jgi:hypothetical protein
MAVKIVKMVGVSLGNCARNKLSMHGDLYLAVDTRLMLRMTLKQNRG